ncbi:hypothetical protein JCM10450v2_006475 [Rhodotorula kratochvilovae]
MDTASSPLPSFVNPSLPFHAAFSTASSSNASPAASTFPSPSSSAAGGTPPYPPYLHTIALLFLALALLVLVAGYTACWVNMRRGAKEARAAWARERARERMWTTAGG